MHTHGPQKGVRRVRVCACETIVPPSNTAHPPAHPSSQLPSHTTSKSSAAGCFITLENSQANPYVAGKEPWPKAGDPTGNVQGFTFLLLLLPKAKSSLMHPAVFRKQQMTEARAVAGVQDLQVCSAFVSLSSTDRWKQVPSSSTSA